MIDLGASGAIIIVIGYGFLLSGLGLGVTKTSLYLAIVALVCFIGGTVLVFI